MVCMMPYGSVDWLLTHQALRDADLPDDMAAILDPQPVSILCHTTNTDILTFFKHEPLVFTAKVHNESLVYLSVNRDINKELLDKMIGSPCGHILDNFNHYCCLYSPSSTQTKQLSQNFTLYKTFRKDPYFHVEDLYYGKPKHVDQRVQFTHVVPGLQEVTVTADHTCRADVITDPYPEIHMKINSRSTDGVHKELLFHWYL